MLRIRISHKLEHQETEHLYGPLELGRGPARAGIPRCILNDQYVSKDHIRLVELESGRVRIENLSQRNSIRLSDNRVIAVGADHEAALPLRLMVGETTVNIEQPPADFTEQMLQPIASPLPKRTDD